MNRLNKQWLQNGDVPGGAAAIRSFALPEKILQFGEGNFMRGFVDWMVHELNKKGLFHGRVVTVQPTPHGKVVPKLNAQDGLYTLVLRGIEKGQVVDVREVVSSISRGINPYEAWDQVLQVAADPQVTLVFSNTTEAGIRYTPEAYDPERSPLSFPGKLTACLYHRFQAFGGDPASGWSIIPCELIEDNGSLLREIVLRLAEDWKLPEEFRTWVKEHNRFCNTLVDRIVTGYPKDEIDRFRESLGYEDELLTVGEPYHLFAIDGDPVVREQIPFEKAGLNVYWADVRPFRELKVRILNGAHTLMCTAALLAGKQTVLEVMQDPAFASFVTEGIFEEILPAVEREEEEKRAFAETVLDRFRNPFSKHYLTDISLNGVTKFKTRLLPTLKAYVRQNGRLPARLTYSLASLLVYCRGERLEGGQLLGGWGGKEYTVRENEDILRLLYETWKQEPEAALAVEAILQNEKIWGESLRVIPGLKEAVIRHVEQMLDHGIDLNDLTF
jgi:tagaturonate reductase